MSGSIMEIEAVTINLNTGYIKEPEGEGEDGPSLFDYLEAAYGVERAESLTIGVWNDLTKAGSLAAKIIADGPPVPNSKMSLADIYDAANEIESLIDSVEVDTIGESKSWEYGDRDERDR